MSYVVHVSFHDPRDGEVNPIATTNAFSHFQDELVGASTTAIE